MADVDHKPHRLTATTVLFPLTALPVSRAHMILGQVSIDYHLDYCADQRVETPEHRSIVQAA